MRVLRAGLEAEFFILATIIIVIMGSNMKIALENVTNLFLLRLTLFCTDFMRSIFFLIQEFIIILRLTVHSNNKIKKTCALPNSVLFGDILVLHFLDLVIKQKT